MEKVRRFRKIGGFSGRLKVDYVEYNNGVCYTVYNTGNKEIMTRDLEVCLDAVRRGLWYEIDAVEERNKEQSVGLD